MDKKQAESVLDSAAGMPGVETLVPLTYSEGVAKGRLSLHDMLRMLAFNPAKVFGLLRRKGCIRVGADADLIILDPAVEWRIDEAEFHSSAGWSPYHALRVQGKIERTLVRGITVYDGTDIVADSGFGRFVAPG
jgi:allantoinase